MTIEEDDGDPEVPVAPPLIDTAGVAAELKKSWGYVNVISLPIDSAPPAVVVKLNVTDTFVLPATRSEFPITNEPADTCPPITPDPTPKDGVTSALVAMTMPLLLPPLASPMVSPASVTVTSLLATSVPLETVTTIEVNVDATAAPLQPPLS
jgi:hypothetical protein